MRVRFEYNEEQGMFHCDTLPPRHQANTYGWRTIADNTDADITTWFCHLIDEAIEKNKIKRKLTVQEVKTCWNAITQSRSEKELLNLAKEYLYS